MVQKKNTQTTLDGVVAFYFCCDNGVPDGRRDVKVGLTDRMDQQRHIG
jgi:hypothetical protein